jgi:hypothetical protein
MTPNIISLPENDIFDVAKRAFHHARRSASHVVNRIANHGANDLARLDRHGLADAGYGRIDWDSEDGEAIQNALIKIYDW